MTTDKSDTAFRTISEVADEIGVAQHVLRFWETKFAAVKPMKRGGNRRYYRPEDVELLRAINRLLYTEGYTIKGVQKLLKEKGQKALAGGKGEAAAQAPVLSAADPATSVRAVPVQADGLDVAMVASLQTIRDRLASALDEARAA